MTHQSIDNIYVEEGKACDAGGFKVKTLQVVAVHGKDIETNHPEMTQRRQIVVKETALGEFGVLETLDVPQHLGNDGKLREVQRDVVVLAVADGDLAEE